MAHVEESTRVAATEKQALALRMPSWKSTADCGRSTVRSTLVTPSLKPGFRWDVRGGMALCDGYLEVHVGLSVEALTVVKLHLAY